MPKRGWFRKSTRYPEGPQKRMLSEAGYTNLYTEGQESEFLRSLRRGETFGVPTLGRFASSRERTASLVVEILGKGATIHEVSTGLKIDPSMLPAIRVAFGAADELGADRKVLSHADAVKYGKKGGPKIRERMPDEEARVFWYNVKRYPDVEDALMQMTGFSKAVAYKRLGSRHGIHGIGRPRKSRT